MGGAVKPLHRFPFLCRLRQRVKLVQMAMQRRRLQASLLICVATGHWLFFVIIVMLLMGVCATWVMFLSLPANAPAERNMMVRVAVAIRVFILGLIQCRS